jgi:hypothetical protein
MLSSALLLTAANAQIGSTPPKRDQGKVEREGK